ncbi:hypothetical protein ACVOMV_28160 [Mesorhizobium atlanticum]
MQLVKDGEVDMASIWNGRAGTLRKSGAPVSFSFGQGVLTADCMVIPKGSKNKDLAMKALAKFVSPDLQGSTCSLYVDNGPARREGFRDRQDPARTHQGHQFRARERQEAGAAGSRLLARLTLVEATEKFNNLIQQ